MRAPPFQSDPLIEWPKWLTKVYAKAHPLLWLALLIALALIPIASKAATVTISGQTCPLSTAYERSDARLIVDGCGTVFVCAPAGASYSTAAELSVPGLCAVDVIKRASFEP